MLATALLVALTVLPAKPASADHFGGPVVLVGLDTEDCGPNGHGGIETWVGLVQNVLLANTTNGGDGILVIGAHPYFHLGLYEFAGPIGFWNFIGEATGEEITFGDENSDFAGYQMIAIVASDPETCGGLTHAQNTVLTSRAAEFAAFVNGGGGLFASEQSRFPLEEQFAFVGGLGAITTAHSYYTDIEPSPEGRAAGIDDSLDVIAWHIIFTEFPDWLKPLAYRAGMTFDSTGTRVPFVTSEVAAIGGVPVVFPVTPGGEFPEHPPPPPPPSPGLLDGVITPPQPSPSPSPGLLDRVIGLLNRGPSGIPTPSSTPSPTTVDTAASAAGNTTPPRDGSTGPVPIGGVKAGGGGTASGSSGRTAAIMLVSLAAVAHFVTFVRRKTGAGGQWRF